MTIKPPFTAEQTAAINAAGREFEAKMLALGDGVRAMTAAIEARMSAAVRAMQEKS